MEAARHILLAGADYLQLKHDLQYSILLETDESVTIGDVLAQLPKDNRQWGAGYISPVKFLVRSPLSWKRQAVIRGDADLGANKFKVNSNISEVSLQSEWSKIWVRLKGLPYELRGLETLSEIVQGFGTFVEVDHNTKENLDLRWARVRVSVPDDFSIPPYVPLKITNRRKETFVWRVPIEQENDFSEPLLNVAELGRVNEPNVVPTQQNERQFHEGPPIVNPTVHVPNNSGVQLNGTDSYPIPYLVHLDDVFADMINGHVEGMPTTHIPDFYPYRAQPAFASYEQGNSSMDGTNFCMQDAANDFEHLTKDPTKYLGEENPVEVNSGKRDGHKRKMKKKLCAIKMRINFGSTSYSIISADALSNSQSDDSESSNNATHEPNHAANQPNVANPVSHNSPICTIRFTCLEHPIDATPLRFGGLARTSVRLACKRMTRARERRMMRGGTSSAPPEEVTSLSDNDEVNVSSPARRRRFI